MSTATFGTANHPFRARLPLRVLRRLPRHEPEVEARIAAARAMELAGEERRTEAVTRRRFPITAQDVKQFLLAYIACFVAVSAWIN